MRAVVKKRASYLDAPTQPRITLGDTRQAPNLLLALTLLLAQFTQPLLHVRGLLECAPQRSREVAHGQAEEGRFEFAEGTLEGGAVLGSVGERDEEALELDFERVEGFAAGVEVLGCEGGE